MILVAKKGGLAWRVCFCLDLPEELEITRAQHMVMGRWD